MEMDAPGTYVLELELPSPADIAVGALGMLSFAPGVYAYVGSAMNGLRGRIARHLHADKKTHWHIDYLLREATVTQVWHVVREQRECGIAAALSDRCKGVAGFGCSDCRCRSHLFFCGDMPVLSRTLAGLGLTASTPDAWR